MEKINKKIIKWKIFFRKALTKLGFSKNHDYGNFRKRRNIIIGVLAGVLIVIAIISFMLGSYYKTEALRAETKEQKEIIEELNTQNDQLVQGLNNKSIYIDQLETNLSTSGLQIVQLQESLQSVQDELVEVDSQMKQEKEQYEIRIAELEKANGELDAEILDYASDLGDSLDIIQNSVRAVCCSFSEIQQATSLNWGIIGNQISCSDSYQYSVNCGTGITDYEG